MGVEAEIVGYIMTQAYVKYTRLICVTVRWHILTDTASNLTTLPSLTT